MKNLTESTKQSWIVFAVILMLFLLQGCQTAPLPPSSFMPAKPALPPQARQTALTTPSECSPTCLEGLRRERKSMREQLTKEGLPASTANADTTPSPGASR